MDGWMDGWMDETNQTIKPYCLHIHTNTSQCVPLWDKPYCLHIQAHAHTSVPVCPSVSQCTHASHCGINHTVYIYIQAHIHTSVPVCPSQCVPVHARVPLWDKPYCLHIHTSAKQCVRPSASVPNDDDVDDVRDIRPPVERRRRRRRRS
jgi:hypothetical protein